MTFSSITKIGLFLALCFLFLYNYITIRGIIWSIIWCDKGGKYNKLQTIKKNKTVWERIQMKYLAYYVDEHKNAFIFWMKIKKIYFLTEVALLIVYIVCCFFWPNNAFVHWLVKFILLQSGLIYLILLFQEDINRLTKYDRQRMSKK